MKLFGNRNKTAAKNAKPVANDPELQKAIRSGGLSRREMLRTLGLCTGAAVVASYGFGSRAFAGVYDEVYPTSPLILEPFTDLLPIPVPLEPCDPNDHPYEYPIKPSYECVDSDDAYPHQCTPRDLGLPEPIRYKIKLQVNEHRFTTSKVLPIDRNGLGVNHPLDGLAGPRTLPPSTIYGFNGTFPGPMIYAKYGQPVSVRFENQLHLNPLNLDRGDFGDPELGFLTHLHNAHSAPESDGNPHFRPHAYRPGEWCDSLYLNTPAGGDNREKQTFFWFHDHREGHTSDNVYKGMVGLFPIYDQADNGDETDPKTYRLPGVLNKETRRIDYDIPLAFFDCALDDGVTGHKDYHNGGGEAHPEWWGKTFFRHFPNHGFVGDIFTVNGTASPVMEVKRRKYRFRFLDASIARQYKFSLMSSTGGPKSSASLGYGGDELQGQYRLPDGQQSMKFYQVAADGGLLPKPIVRNDFELWPGNRKEVIVDFTKYLDGTPTKKGDVIYLVNTAKMLNGRKLDSSDPNYKVPVIKFVIGDDAPDNSVIPRRMREQPEIGDIRGLKRRTFELQRGGSMGGETEWLINGKIFDGTSSADVPMGSAEVWTIRNGGGGWSHPMHFHYEEHRILTRNRVKTPTPQHLDDHTKQDVLNLEPGEEAVMFRRFRSFKGNYVAHCHNLAHEDHNMMFGFRVV